MMTKSICFVAYASQPDIQFYCDDGWDTPDWNQPKDLPTDVHLATGGRCYTFDEEFTTCPGCMKKIIVRVFQEKKAISMQFSKGYQDGLKGEYNPTSMGLSYVDGYEKGRRFRKMTEDD